MRKVMLPRPAGPINEKCGAGPSKKWVTATRPLPVRIGRNDPPSHPEVSHDASPRGSHVRLDTASPGRLVDRFRPAGADLHAAAATSPAAAPVHPAAAADHHAAAQL